MGIYDRDYYQDERPAGIQIAGQWSIVGKLIALNVGIYVLDIFTNGRLMDVLAAKPSSLTEPWQIWQLLSYGFAHDPNHVQHIFWNMFGLFVFGRDVEGVYGSREFLRIYLVTVVLGGLFWVARSVLAANSAAQMLGASGAVTAITLLFCLHFPKRTILLMFVLPVPAWAVGLLVITVNVLGVTNPEAQTAFDVHLVGAAFAIAYYKFGWNMSRFTFRVPRPRTWWKPRPKLKLHDPETYYEDLDAEADQLLQKVKRDGIDSLTDGERRKLEDYSRRMRQKHR